MSTKDEKILLVLAGGMGSRYGGFKQIVPVGNDGELIIDYSVHDAIRAGFTRAIFVIKPEIEREFVDGFFNRIKKHIKAEYVLQLTPEWREKPLGTMSAVLSAAHLLDSPFCVISADDFYGYDAFSKVTEDSTVGYLLSDTLSDYGTVNRGVIETDKNKNIVAIHEWKCKRDGDKIGYICGDEFVELPKDTHASMCMFMLNPEIIPALREKFATFLAQKYGDPRSEHLLPPTISELISEKKIEIKMVETTGHWVGFTYPEDRDNVRSEIQKLIATGVYKSPLW